MIVGRSFENIPLVHHLETDLYVYHGLYSIDSLRDPLLNSEYGLSLASLEPRFSAYWWEDMAKFQEMFGPDVDPVQHGPYQARTVAIPLLDAQKKEQNLRQIEYRIQHHFVAHHVQHDDHEGEFARIKGMKSDVPHRSKTTALKAEELALWFKINNELFGTATARTQNRFVEEFETGTSWLATLWDVSERIGYMETGHRALQLAFETDGLTNGERAICRNMGRRVVGRHYPIIDRSRDTIAYASSAISQTTVSVDMLCDDLDITREELFSSEAA
jgi:hypothetical protein